MELTAVDYVLLAGAGALVAWGAVKGLSGQLASVAWVVTLLAACGFGYAPVRDFFARTGLAGPGGERLAAVGATVALALLAALVAWLLVRKFVSLLVPQPFNALLGSLAGFLKAVALLALLAWTGLFAGGSRLVAFAAAVVDRCCAPGVAEGAGR